MYGDRVVLVGGGQIAPHPKNSADLLGNLGVVVLTGGRQAKSLDRVARVPHGNYTTHAYAIAGKALLVGISNDNDRRAAIARIPLP